MKKWMISLIAAGALLSAAVPGKAEERMNPQPLNQVDIPVSKTVLENGLTVLVAEMPDSPVVSVYMLVKTGSATEGEFLGAGISHFLEHLVFKGTSRRKAGEISAKIQAMGGDINATTSFDYTIFLITVPSSNFAEALDVLADMMMNASVDPEEFNREREVVINEIRLYQDRPDRRLSQMVFDTVYLNHPYKIPVIGYEDLLKAVTRDDVLRYYKEKYTPANMVLSVAGGVSAAAVKPLIEETFKDFPRTIYEPRLLAEEPPQQSERRTEDFDATDLTRMSLAFSGVALSSPDMPAMDVLAMILGQGQTSRLYLDLLKKKKLVKSISAFNYTPLDPGFFGIDAVLDYDAVEDVILEIKAQVAEIARHGIRGEELSNAQTRMVRQYVSEHQTTHSVAYSQAVDEAQTGDERFSEAYLRQVQALTPQDIQDAARTYLTDDHLSTAILAPKKYSDTEPAGESDLKKDFPVQKVSLSNGITLLLKRNPQLPLVSMTVALNGGTRLEPDGKGGISNLTARLWTRGTSSRSAEEITRQLEARGGSVSGFSGRNSMGLNLSILSSGTEFALDLISELIRKPAFPEKELAVQKDIVKTQIAAQNDSVPKRTLRALRETLFEEHPFRRDSLGSPESVDAVSREDIIGFYQKLNAANHMVISVFGDIDPDEMAQALKKRFQDLPDKDIPKVSLHEAAPEQPRIKEMDFEKKQAMVAIGFQGVDLASPDRTGLEVLTNLLGSSFSGRIFNTIREKYGQAYTLGGNVEFSLDTGMIYFYVQTTPQAVDQVKDTLTGLLKEIREEPVGAEELDSMKAYLKGRHMMGLQTNSSQAFMEALDELYGQGYDYSSQYEGLVDAVTPETLQSLARKYLDLDRAAIVVARPVVPVQTSGDGGSPHTEVKP